MIKNKISRPRSRQAGFTLIELLVVIAIIGLLATIAVVALGSARKSARDAKRIGDIKQVQTGLELFFNANSSYTSCTADTKVSEVGGSPDCTDGLETYLAGLATIKDPSSPSVDCTAENCTTTSTAACEYEYLINTDASTYTIQFNLEGDSGSLKAGCNVASPSGIVHK